MTALDARDGAPGQASGGSLAAADNVGPHLDSPTTHE